VKIMVVRVQHETNPFAPSKATYESFERGEDFPSMVRGQAVLDLLNVNIPIGGFVNHVQAKGHEVLPVIWALGPTGRSSKWKSKKQLPKHRPEASSASRDPGGKPSNWSDT
jgi:microcystin degradation protein MlrC